MRYLILPLLALAACEMALPSAVDAPARIALVSGAPKDAAPGTCWGQQTTPAVIETVERDILITPAQVSPDGVIQQPAVYRKQRAQEIVVPRQRTWFQVPCAADLTPDFVATLQRALTARGLYAGPISGQMTPRTRTAIQTFQASNGFDSQILTTETARQLGLVAVDLAPEE